MVGTVTAVRSLRNNRRNDVLVRNYLLLPKFIGFLPVSYQIDIRTARFLEILDQCERYLHVVRA